MQALTFSPALVAQQQPALKKPQRAPSFGLQMADNTEFVWEIISEVTRGVPELQPLGNLETGLKFPLLTKDNVRRTTEGTYWIHPEGRGEHDINRRASFTLYHHGEAKMALSLRDSVEHRYDPYIVSDGAWADKPFRDREGGAPHFYQGSLHQPNPLEQPEYHIHQDEAVALLRIYLGALKDHLFGLELPIERANYGAECHHAHEIGEARQADERGRMFQKVSLTQPARKVAFN